MQEYYHHQYGTVYHNSLVLVFFIPSNHHFSVNSYTIVLKQDPVHNIVNHFSHNHYQKKDHTNLLKLQKYLRSKNRKYQKKIYL